MINPTGPSDLDPYAHLRHLDGQPVTIIRPVQLVEDVNGDPAGVIAETEPPTVLHLPPLPEDDDDPDDDGPGAA